MNLLPCATVIVRDISGDQSARRHRRILISLFIANQRLTAFIVASGPSDEARDETREKTQAAIRERTTSIRVCDGPSRLNWSSAARSPSHSRSYFAVTAFS